MKFEAGKTYHIIGSDKAKKLVNENVLELHDLIGYRHRNYNSYLLNNMLGKTFVANSDGDKLNHCQKINNLDGCYAIYPWMCAEYYNRTTMETE